LLAGGSIFYGGTMKISLLKNLVEQTEIASRLRISNKQFKRIAETAGLEFILINDRRHYDFPEVLAAIQRGKEVHREVR